MTDDKSRTTAGTTPGGTTTGPTPTDRTPTGRTPTGATTPDLAELPQEMLDSAHRVWLAGLGALARAGEEGGKLFRQLVDRGREVEGEGRETFERTLDTARQTAESAREKVGEAGRSARERVGTVGETLEAQVTSVLQRIGVPSRTEIRDLTRRIEALTAQVEGLQGAAGATPATGSTVPAKQPPKLPATTESATAKPKAAGGVQPSRSPRPSRSTPPKTPKPGGVS